MHGGRGAVACVFWLLGKAFAALFSCKALCNNVLWMESNFEIFWLRTEHGFRVPGNCRAQGVLTAEESPGTDK